MKWMEKLKNLFRKKQMEAPAEAGPGSQTPQKVKRACKKCGKMFTVDPSWEHIPNYCKECKKQFVAEKEAKQRAGEPRKIKRKCRECGNYFTFPNTLEHYPNYCNNCRKRHQAAMKEKYSRMGKAKAQP